MKKYGILSILFLLFSLVGGIFLVKNNQDNRNKAAVGDKCSSGQEICQKNRQNTNTGFLCKCLTSLDPNDWQCTTRDLNKCSTESGGTDPGSGTYDGCTVNGVVVGNIVGRCIVAVSGKSLPQMWKYKCPGRTDLSGGCQENEQVVSAGSSSVCFENNFCGTQQIDSDVWQNCFMSVVDICTNPTSPPSYPTTPLKPTSTPIPTNTPKLTSTPKPTSTPIPTLTPRPTATLTPGPTTTPIPTLTPGPTITPGPTSTPVPPTNTPIPTTVIAEGPSPTRIILPQSGVEFPSQMLTIFGGIVTLLGFLILL